jgi:hypothetical protein
VPIALLLEALDSWLTGGSVTLDTTTVTLVLAQFDRRLWRSKHVRKLLREPSWMPPDLHGTWRMELTKYMQIQDAKDDRDPGCYFIVEQTASEIRVRMLFSDAESSSTRAVLYYHQGDVILDFLYELKPHSRDEPYRRGAASYRLARGCLSGTHWNEWGGRGHTESDAHLRNLCDDFQEAREALGVPPSGQTLGPEG